MNLYLDTSTPETILKLDDKEYRYVFANDLAEKLLGFLRDKLAENQKTFQDLTEIIFIRIKHSALRSSWQTAQNHPPRLWPRCQYFKT